jgi:hypothetical protein
MQIPPRVDMLYVEQEVRVRVRVGGRVRVRVRVGGRVRVRVGGRVSDVATVIGRVVGCQC